MHLPELEWQILYGRLAWAVVLATAIAALLPQAWRNRAASLGLLAGCAALAALPGDYSPAYWLVLAFQWPSAVLVGCCLLRLAGTGSQPHALPVLLAAPVALAGTVLYLDAIGWLSLGLYGAGFGPQSAAIVALGAGCAAVIAIAHGRVLPQALILLGAVALYSIARLPTGNLWDALLDPLLWGWALAALCARGVRTLRNPFAARAPA
ncbi:hypothetical protein [Pseudoduganella sp. GCM10020061]|uniref:hypothetical protein n=1 Tax=Pseudoduganella sp. GCM10020061 TaxID=3317345 RepID=UPI0036453DE9